MARIFLCHASEDKAQVREVYHRLRAIEGFEPWLDEEDLLPGQIWEREIPRALQTSDFILIFLSRTSVAKHGYIGAPGVTGGKFTVRCLLVVFAAPRDQVIKKGVGDPTDFGLENQSLFLTETLII